MENWYIGNLCFGGLTGCLIVDPITGAMWTLPETLAITLSQKVSFSTGNQTSLVIALRGDVPARIMSQATLVQQ